MEKGSPPADGDAAVGSNTGHYLGGDGEGSHVPSTDAGHAGVGSGPGQVLSKCMHEIAKCEGCGKMVKGYEKKPEPEGGPGEMENKFLKTLEPQFQKLTEDFSKKYEEKIETLTKSFKEELAASSARIEQLHKALDDKSKVLAAEQDEIQKNSSTGQTAKKEEPAKGMPVLRIGF